MYNDDNGSNEYNYVDAGDDDDDNDSGDDDDKMNLKHEVPVNHCIL
jgi:hypothetical protein